MEDNLHTLFDNIKDDFDIEVPNIGHNKRFLDKLNTQHIVVNVPKRNLWKPFIGIAASITLLVSLFVLMPREDVVPDLASISPEMAKTESVFNVTLQNELKKIDAEEYPEYQELIVDALFEIKVLEEGYNQLIYGLKENPEDQLVLSAMILNLQSRIDVLQDVMQEIENMKKLNNNTTII